MSSVLLALVFGAAAFLYAMVGHGGASGYMAIGALMGQPLAALKTQALVLNLGVSALASVSFYRAGHLRGRLLLPLLLTSAPAAFAAARLPVPLALAQGLLALALSAAALRLAGHAWLRAVALQPGHREATPAALALSGLGIGFLSGLTGVGGGIYLSPLLILFKWADVKEAAACSAVFIFVNSMAGLGGHLAQGPLPQVPLEWLASTLFFGAVGAWLGAGWMPRRRLAQVLAGILLLAAVKLGWQALS